MGETRRASVHSAISAERTVREAEPPKQILDPHDCVRVSVWVRPAIFLLFVLVEHSDGIAISIGTGE